jgi:hypothetical protein
MVELAKYLRWKNNRYVIETDRSCDSGEVYIDFRRTGARREPGAVKK